MKQKARKSTTACKPPRPDAGNAAAAEEEDCYDNKRTHQKQSKNRFYKDLQHHRQFIESYTEVTAHKPTRLQSAMQQPVLKHRVSNRQIDPDYLSEVRASRKELGLNAADVEAPMFIRSNVY